MSAAHMGMVFAAEGLDGTEKLLLLGYTNYTDPHGYCWPSEDRLADDCGTSRSTVQRGKRKLVAKNLIKGLRRSDPVTDEPTSNLTRVNLPLLASMARKRDKYDDDLINAIHFEDDTQGDPFSTLGGTPDDPEPTTDQPLIRSDSYPEADRLRPRVNVTHGPGQDDSQSTTDPVRIPDEIPTPLPDARRAGTGSSAREPGGSAASGTKQQPFTSKQGKQAAEFVRILPPYLRRYVPSKRPRNFTAAVIAALAAEQPHERTPEQLVQFRVLAKWDKHWGAEFGAGRVDRPIGAIIRMLERSAECGDPRCDERVNVDTGRPCSSCGELVADRKQDRKAEAAAQVAAEQGAADYYPEMPEAGTGEPPEWADVPQQRSEQPPKRLPMRTCDDCGRVFRAASTSPSCGECVDQSQYV